MPEVLKEFQWNESESEIIGEEQPLLIQDSLEEISFVIQGVPLSGSQLKFNRATGNAYRPKEHKQRVFEVYEFAKRAVEDKIDELPYFKKGMPVILSVVFYFPYRGADYRTGSKSHLLKDNAPKYVIGNKDIDNLLKPLKDGLKGVVIADDKQIVGYGEMWKLYSESPRTEVKVKRII